MNRLKIIGRALSIIFEILVYCFLLALVFMEAYVYRNALATLVLLLGTEIPLALILNECFKDREAPTVRCHGSFGIVYKITQYFKDREEPKDE